MDNISSQEFEQRISYFNSDNFIQEIDMSETFISPKVHIEKIDNNSQISDKKIKALIKGVINSYEAGYYGK